MDSSTVSVIATASNTVVATIPVGKDPDWRGHHPNGKFAYVTNRISNTVFGDRHGQQHGGGHIPVGISPLGVAITPDGKFAYVANRTIVHTVSVISTASNTVVATIPVGNPP